MEQDITNTKSPRSKSSLEARAGQIVKRLDGKPWDVSPLSMIEREIAFVVMQLDTTREFHDELNHGLTIEECYVNSEMLQLRDRTPRYESRRFPEREKLQRSLGRLAEQRRRLDIDMHEKSQKLNAELLSLLEKHAQLI